MKTKVKVSVHLLSLGRFPSFLSPTLGLSRPAPQKDRPGGGKGSDLWPGPAADSRPVPSSLPLNGKENFKKCYQNLGN